MTWQIEPELRALAALCKELNLAGVGSEMRDSLPGLAIRTSTPGVYVHVTPMRKRRMALTEHERQILMAELADIATDLDALQERTVEVTARVARCSAIRLARSA